MRYLKPILALCLIMLFTPAMAGSEFVEGQDYTLLPNKLRSKPEVAELIAKDPKKVQVLLFFSYGCPACARLEPSFESWASSQRDAKIVIKKVPAAFEDEWEMLAKMYYIMQDLEPRQDLSGKIFTAIQDQDVKLWQEDEMKSFFINHGYSEQEFSKVYNSSNLNSQVKFAKALENQYKIMRTPTIIINGPKNSYLLTVDQADDNVNKFFKIVNFVIHNEEVALK